MSMAEKAFDELFPNKDLENYTFNIKYTEEDYVDFDDIEPSKAFLEEFEFSRQNIDVFSSEASRCENVIYPIIRDFYKHFVGKYALWSHKSISHNQVLSGTPDYIISTKSLSNNYGIVFNAGSN